MPQGAVRSDGELNEGEYGLSTMPDQEQVPIRQLLGTIHLIDRSVDTHGTAVQHHCEAPTEPQPKDNCRLMTCTQIIAPKRFSRRHKPMRLELLVQ